ncbi:hypothetical protein [Leclercia sp. AS011]|uniref:hypothetical protein n=1 Tax=Leclercia sp. AS011 TaxID=3081257 RepID=UPI00301A864A
MSELFLSVFGVAAAIAFIFYRMGYTQGHRGAHCGNATRSMAELEKAVNSASMVLKSERETADFYRTRCKNFDEINDLFNENMEIIEKSLNNIRGDVIEADTFNRELLESMHKVQHFIKSVVLMNGEQLEQADFRISREEYQRLSESYRSHDKEEIEGDIQSAESRGKRNRDSFMNALE